MVDASLRDATEFIRARCPEKVDAGLILGSGLGQLADQISAEAQFDYGQIPGFAATTAGGHRGQLLIGTLQGRRVAAMAGRFHAYEGHDRNKITFPVRVMRALGAGLMIVSNAAGGLRPTYQVGDIVIIRDHIDWIYGSPQSLSSGADPDALPSDHGVLNRLGAMYDLELSLRATESLTRQGHPAHQGTYLATLGPNYETRAEYRMMRRMGADLAGMST
ncbi:MAG: purine-nucleoside phosphorylase, partial [Planctomycetota bacterium]